MKLRLIRKKPVMMKVHFITLYAFAVPLGVFSVVTMFLLAIGLRAPWTRAWNIVFTGLFLLALELETIRQAWLRGEFHHVLVDLVSTEHALEPTR